MSQDGLNIFAKPVITDLVETAKAKVPEIIESVVGSVVKGSTGMVGVAKENVSEAVKSVFQNSNAISQLTDVEFGLIIGLPAFFLGLCAAFLVCTCLIPGILLNILP